MFERVRRRTYEILEKGAPGDIPSRAFDIFIITLIALNVLAVILGTVDTLDQAYGPAFSAFEAISIAVFSVEYFLRLWSCPTDPRYRSGLLGRLRFVLSPMALVDLTAILPFYLPMLIPFDLRFVRALRLVRLFRILKIGRYSEAVRLFGRVMRAKKEELVVTLFVVGIMLVLTSSVMYFVEHGAQPQAFSSIPAAMWWGVATLTTVGYGDVYPVTPWGKACGAVVAILGVATFALPAGIIASGFTEELRRTPVRRRCPHCGKEVAAWDDTE